MNRHVHRPRVAVCHVSMRRGGSEGDAMWAIQALKGDHRVSLLTVGNMDLDALNAFYGTNVDASEVTLRRAPAPGWLRTNRRGAELRSRVFQRFCRQIANQFDVLFSAYNPVDFGVPAIHRVADFSWDPGLRAQLDGESPGDSGGPGRNPLNIGYQWLARRFNPPSGRDVLAGDDPIVANSHWTANILRTRHGARNVEVVHPPVIGAEALVPFELRSLGFVCLGRISPEKKIERAIEILEKVRRRGHALTLHIVGALDDSPYGRKVAALCGRRRDWIVPEGCLVGQAKFDLLKRCRFGMHACTCEAFGNAVAEMVKSGIVPFVFDQSGPAEIVNHPALQYRDVEEAVEKIDRVLRDANFARDLHEHARRRGCLYTVEGYMQGVRRVVAGFRDREHAAVA
jgi:glycosyltransferase involved in cell wall biosynthesis